MGGRIFGFRDDSTEWIITRVDNILTGDGGYTQRLELEIRATEVPDTPQNP